MMTSRPPKRGGGLLTISVLTRWCDGSEGPGFAPLRGIHPAGEFSGDHSRFSAESMFLLGDWMRLESRSVCVTWRSKALALLEGNLVRPGMTNVSSDERRCALVCVEAFL